MPDHSILQDGTLTTAGAGFFGSLVSLKFIKGASTFERVMMFIGGMSLSFYATSAVAGFLGMSRFAGGVGFLLGLFGMAVVGKVYEALQAVDAADLAKRAVNRIFNRSGE